MSQLSKRGPHAPYPPPTHCRSRLRVFPRRKLCRATQVTRGAGSIRSATSRVMWKEDLHDPWRIIWEIWFVFLTLIVVPPAVLLPFLPRLGLFLGNLRVFVCTTTLKITNLTQRHLASQYLLLDLGTDHFPMTLDAGSGGERSMTLKNGFYSCGGL